MTTLSYISYKQALKSEITKKKQLLGKRITNEKMAIHCGIQKTYLSKVLNQDGHFSEDQLYMACDYLKLSEEDCEYLILLLRLERSQNQKRRESLKQQISTIKRQSLLTETSIDAKQASENLTEYYLNPMYPLIHMGLTIKKFANKPSDLAKALSLPDNIFADIITELQSFGFIKLKENSIEVLQDSLHLSKTSKWYPYYKKAMDHLAEMHEAYRPNDDSYSFNVILSADEDVRDEIHKDFLAFLKKTQKKVEKRDETSLYQMKFNLMQWA